MYSFRPKKTAKVSINIQTLDHELQINDLKKQQELITNPISQKIEETKK